MLRPRQLPMTVTRILLCDCLLYECTFIVIHAALTLPYFNKPIVYPFVSNERANKPNKKSKCRIQKLNQMVFEMKRC